MQSPQDCSAARILLLGLQKSQDWPLGRVIRAVNSALAEAFYENRTLVLASTSFGATVPWCSPADGWACWFEPVSSCSERYISAEERAALAVDPFDDNARVKLADEARGDAAALVCPKRVRPQLAKQGDADVMWGAVLAAIVFRPRQEALSQVKSIASKAFAATPPSRSVLHLEEEAVSRFPLDTLLSHGVDMMWLNAPTRSILIAGSFNRRQITKATAAFPNVTFQYMQREDEKRWQQRVAEIAEIQVLARARTVVAFGTSHNGVAGIRLRVAHGHGAGPVLIDHAEMERGDVACAHMAACEVVQAKSSIKRWFHVQQSLVHNPLAPAQGGVDVYFDVVRGIPHIPRELLYNAAKTWNQSEPLSDACPRDDAKNRLSAASLINLGGALFEVGHKRRALGCFLLAQRIASDDQHIEIARENAYVIRNEALAAFRDDEKENEEEEELGKPMTSSEGSRDQSAKGAPKQRGADVKQADQDESSTPKAIGDESGKADNQRAESPAACPWEVLGSFDSIQVQDLLLLGRDTLYKQGKLEEASACFELGRGLLSEGRQASAGVSDETRQWSARLHSVLASLSSSSAGLHRRVHHNLGGKGPTFPAVSAAQRRQPDGSIQVWDGGLNANQCEALIGLFNSTESVKVLGDDGVVAYEEVECRGSDSFGAALLSLLIKFVIKYEEQNPAVKSLKSPLRDEGFRIRRFLADQHLPFHTDIGGGTQTSPDSMASQRVLTMLVSLNALHNGGGEIQLLQQGVTIAPECGRVIMFPSSFTHVYGSAAPMTQSRFELVNFLSL